MPIKPDRGDIPMPAYRPYRPHPFMNNDAQNEARDLAARERAARDLQARDTMQAWQRYDAYIRQFEELQMREGREWIRREQQAEARMLAMPKDHWVIENDTLSGVFDGHAVSMSKKDGQDIWEKINKMTIAQKRDYWGGSDRFGWRLRWRRFDAKCIPLGDGKEGIGSWDIPFFGGGRGVCGGIS